MNRIAILGAATATATAIAIAAMPAGAATSPVLGLPVDAGTFIATDDTTQAFNQETVPGSGVFTGVFAEDLAGGTASTDLDPTGGTPFGIFLSQNNQPGSPVSFAFGVSDTLTEEQVLFGSGAPFAFGTEVDEAGNDTIEIAYAAGDVSGSFAAAFPRGLLITLDGEFGTDPFGAAFFDGAASATFSPATIPLPAGLPFLLTGIAALAWVGRRRAR